MCGDGNQEQVVSRKSTYGYDSIAPCGTEVIHRLMRSIIRTRFTLSPTLPPDKVLLRDPTVKKPSVTHVEWFYHSPADSEKRVPLRGTQLGYPTVS